MKLAIKRGPVTKPRRAIEAIPVIDKVEREATNILTVKREALINNTIRFSFFSFFPFVVGYNEHITFK